jgi:uncharacterized OsmC-like protein
MQGLPHEYRVNARSDAEGHVSLSAEGLESLTGAPPKQFGGPGDRWSPEDLLVASVTSCFVLSFRAIAKASRFAFSELHCDAVGTLDRVEGRMRFTRLHISARVTVPAGSDPERARRLMEKAEQTCLVTNSLSCERHLETGVELV